MTLVITTCTNRKRKPVLDSLHVSSLPKSAPSDLAIAWCARLSDGAPRFAAEDVYGGRGFQEAVTASELLDARLLIASAGVGLVDASTKIPPYACTILTEAADSVSGRALGNMTSSDWWSQLVASSPFSKSVKDVAGSSAGLICAALSDAYIEMIAGDLIALPEADQQRLRIFTRAPIERIAQALRAYVMPYDDRLDGPDSPIRGTRSDFSGRALHHFAEHILCKDDERSAAKHAVAVTTAISLWRPSARHQRFRHDDAALKALIVDHWAAAGGRSSRLLRLFRDELNIACEQGRFAGLVRDVRASMS